MYVYAIFESLIFMAIYSEHSAWWTTDTGMQKAAAGSSSLIATLLVRCFLNQFWANDPTCLDVKKKNNNSTLKDPVSSQSSKKCKKKSLRNLRLLALSFIHERLKSQILTNFLGWVPCIPLDLLQTSKFTFYAVTSDAGEIAANEEKICASSCSMLIFVPISWVKVMSSRISKLVRNNVNERWNGFVYQKSLISY